MKRIKIKGMQGWRWRLKIGTEAGRTILIVGESEAERIIFERRNENKGERSFNGPKVFQKFIENKNNQKGV